MTETTIVSADRERTRTAMDLRARRAASGLLSLGVRPGDTIALLLRNDFAFFEASLAATALGASPVAINWHLAPSEINYVLQDCGTRVLIAHADLLHLLGDAIPKGLAVFTVETPDEVLTAYGMNKDIGKLRPALKSWDGFVASNPVISEPCREFTDTMLYTSGTTGRPKGVRRYPQDPETANKFLALRDRIYGIEPGIRGLICGPMYHAAPNAFAMRAITAAETVILMARFEPELFLKTVERKRITTVFMVPTMFVRLLKLPPEIRNRYDITSLRHVLTAAAYCPADVKQAICDWFGPIVHEFFGGTESSYVSYCSPEDSFKKPGSVGRLVDGVSLRIVDETGTDVLPGKPGEILTSLDIAPGFTYANRAADRQELDRGGLIATGDVGYLDEDGYLFLCDRRRDMVISGGVNIYPAEIESALLTHPDVQDCAVFGIPDPEFGEKLFGVIQCLPDTRVTADELIGHLKPHLAGFKIPRTFEFRDALPRDDAGKIYKRKLRDPHWMNTDAPRTAIG